jgi:hypothetical protein
MKNYFHHLVSKPSGDKMNRFAKFSWFILAWAVLDVLWGAFVRVTVSGAGCGNHGTRWMNDRNPDELSPVRKLVLLFSRCL